MGMTHGEPDTFPRTGDVIGFCTTDEAIDVAEKVVTIQRDWGDRSDRKHARLKYTIERAGLDGVPRRARRPARPQARARPGASPSPARAIRRAGSSGDDGAWHFLLFVENGRVHDRG